MPELPEAETIARGLHACAAGGTVERVRVHRHELVEPCGPPSFRRALRDRTIRQVGRRGKWILASLNGGGRWVTQLRMTGRFTWTDPSPLRRERHLSLSARLEGAGGRVGILRFYDIRRFARMRVLDEEAWAEIDAQLGIEPLSADFTADALHALLANSKAPLRNVLLDQRRIAGVGNIYANEACHQARLDPRRPAGGLGRGEVERLRRALQQVLSEAIERRGTSLSDYRDLLGGRGDFQNALRVYGRTGGRCHRCGDVVQRAVLAGRSAFFCPGCQT